MGQTLSNGIYLPAEGERNCYAGLASNWQILNTAVGAIAEKAPLVHTHTVSQITDFPAYGNTAGTICEGNDSRLSDARTPVAHTHTKSDVTDLFNSANTWSANNKFTGNVTIEKNSSSPTTISDSSLSLNGNSNYVFFRTKGSSNFKSYNSWLWAGYFGAGYAGEERRGHLKIYRASDMYGETGEDTPDTSFSFIDVALHFKKVNITDNVSFKNDGTINACYPVYNNATDLGYSTNQWNNLYANKVNTQSVNGINPGALSFPNYSDTTYIDISGSIVPPTGETEINKNLGDNYYTPPVDGWLSIRCDGAKYLQIYRKSYNCPGVTAGDGTGNIKLVVTLPVRKNETYTIRIKKDSAGIEYYQLYPCLGNV